MITLTQRFTFEAAHFLPSAPEGDPNRRMHGHSFTVDVSLSGTVDPVTGLLVHFDDIRSAIEPLRLDLDHRLLNELPGLAAPTLERLAEYIFNKLAAVLPGVTAVSISRPSCGETCVYQPADTL